MRKRIILCGTLLVMLLTACSDWLDVNPRTEVKEDDVYANEDGYRGILNGVYIRMADAGLYGKNTSYYIPELLARHYTLSYNTVEYNIGNYLYTNATVESTFESMWKKYYECIAHLNDILTNAAIHRDIFTPSGYKIITGEALGLRAFLHFELLRWFGPVPVEGIDREQPAIPYAEELTKDPDKLNILSYGVVLEKILRDFDAAEEALKDDPIVESTDNNVTGADDDWLMFRQSRFNLYAVKGAKARFYQWTGDRTNAIKYAREVVDAKNADGTVKFELANETYMTNPGGAIEKNLVFMREHLFGIHNPKLLDIVNPLFSSTYRKLTQSASYINSAYEPGQNPDDIRYKGQRFWTGGSFNNFLKYLDGDTYKAQNVVPLMRIAEMYLILMEELPVDEGKVYFETFRKARGMSASMDQSFTMETAARIEKEYRKEFFGEGVMFFYYKRHKTARFTWPFGYNFKTDNYIIPIPKSVEAFE